MKTHSLRFITCLVLLTSPLTAQEAESNAEAIAPFVGEEIVAVAHFDLTAIEVSTFSRQALERPMPEEEIETVSAHLDGWFAALRNAGATDLYVLITPIDLAAPIGWLHQPPAVVVPLEEETDPEAIAALLCGEQWPAWPTCATVHDAVFAGSSAALERVSREPIPVRTELFEAFAASGQGPVRLALIPSATLRRSVEELVPTLPQELGGGPITVLTKDLNWAVVTLHDEPRPALNAVAKSRDPKAAVSFERFARALLAFGAERLMQRDQARPMAEAVAMLEPRVEGDRVRLEIDLTQASALVGLPLRDALEADRRRRCTDNLKQISIAMHNYHSKHEAFPPAYSVGDDGTPLLSWRVHVLPFIQQESLYEQFHLDEPWDSPHNRALIDQVPSIYVCPGVDPDLASEGKTTYLAPRGEQTVLSGPVGTPIKAITDGTSNTIAVIDADPSQAVIWTKPDDWQTGPQPKPSDIFGAQHPGGVNAAFCDGSVRFLRETLDPDVFRALLTIRGGEVISSDDL